MILNQSLQKIPVFEKVFKVSESVKKCFPGRPSSRTTDGSIFWDFLTLLNTLMLQWPSFRKISDFQEILEFLELNDSVTPRILES